MGGVGKSTLVEHIHNQLLERNKCVFWVVVSSQRCSIKMLQDKIATKLGVAFFECMLTYEQYQAPQGSKSPFQALQVIQLYYLKDFMGVIHNLEIESDPPPASVFSSLRSLTILGCHKMKKLGLPLSIFEKLEDITIQDCEEIEEIIQVFAADDDSLFISLPNLNGLWLRNLPSLESFCNAPVICNSLEEFDLRDCPRLEVPFLNWGTPDSYKPLFPGDDVDQIRRHSL